jgi:uncharacterized protein (DUF488 family)
MKSVYTIGHSTRTLEELVTLLDSYAVTALADVRTIPRSRRNPQFDAELLRDALPARGIRYDPFRDLGGLRRPRANSANTGWENPSFRGYADYMSTDRFASALATLWTLATRETVALMCAEAVPWRCHRSLVADALTARGLRVRHIMGASSAIAHRMTAFARVEGAIITYPAADRAGAPPGRRET